MDRNVSISFIIPYYKIGRELLDRAVRSVRAINAPDMDWEVIVVDDGTPDGRAGEWMEEYDDSRIRCVRQENGGLSAARNTGIEAARSDYIQFLDADDYLFPTSYADIVRRLQSDRPDVLIHRWKKVGRMKEIAPPRHSGRTESFASGVEFMAGRSFFAGACSYVFRRQILGGLRFFPGIYHEDEDFTPRLFARAGKLLVNGTAVYAYYQRPGSIINSSDETVLRKKAADRMLILKRLEDFGKTAESEAAGKAMCRRCEQFASAIIYRLLKEASSGKALLDGIEELRRAGYYPLPKRDYTRRYNLFRKLTDRRWKVKIMRIIMRTL